MAEMKKRDIHVNVWEHGFTHPESPIFESLLPYSGDTLVWSGLVPDFATEGARKIFGAQQKTFVDAGIDGFCSVLTNLWTRHRGDEGKQGMPFISVDGGVQHR